MHDRKGKTTMNDTRQKRDNAELFKWDGKPSFGQVLPLAAQHVLAAVVGCVTPAILVANAANNAGGNVDMGLLIQVSLVFAALSTGAGEGCQYDLWRHGYRRRGGDPGRIIYPSDP